MVSRRDFLKASILAGASLLLPRGLVAAGLHPRSLNKTVLSIPGGTLDPGSVTKYDRPMIIPPAMQTSRRGVRGFDGDYYEVAVRQFQQQILPVGLPATTVWSYTPTNSPRSLNYPSFTIEARWNRPVRVRWINDLVDAGGNFLPHLLPVDPTLHWANPPGGTAGRDSRPTFSGTPGRYQGPVPIVTHLHGGHVDQEFDGFAEAWFLPAAKNIPAGFATTGTFYDYFRPLARGKLGQPWPAGSAIFQYGNDQRATTLWYHDHTLGMTRLNVYAGPAGFYVIRGGPDDVVLDTNGNTAVLPGPAPQLGDAAGTRYYEIPIAIQDRSFNADGSLFYPDNRAFFEGLDISQLQIPFIGEDSCEGPSDISPIWNPEFFANMMVVNGRTWPYLDVEQRRYRFRLLNGCNSRFLILELNAPGLEVWQIGAEGGFLAAPVNISAVTGGRLLMGLAERADVIVDFTHVPAGTEIIMRNLAPDEPFGGGEPGVEFDPSDPDSTGQVMAFRVGPAAGPDPSTYPGDLVLPALEELNPTYTQLVSLNEIESGTVLVAEEDGSVVEDCEEGEAFGPEAALLGMVNEANESVGLMWSDVITENPSAGDTATWEIYNTTVDAHPIHIHLVQFKVRDRQNLLLNEEGEVVQPLQLEGDAILPGPREDGFKDTVIAYPGQVTRVDAHFDREGLYAWHCHIVEHEDNEMMRPYHVGAIPPDLPLD